MECRKKKSVTKNNISIVLVTCGADSGPLGVNCREQPQAITPTEAVKSIVEKFRASVGQRR